MISVEYMMYPLVTNIMSQVINFRTGYNTLDSMIILSMIFIFFFIDTAKLKTFITKKFNDLFKTNQDMNKIILRNEGRNRSYKYRAVMYYMSKNKNKSIYSIREVNDFTWDDYNESTEELSSEYVVDQDKEFTLDNDIFGSIVTEQKDKTKTNDKVETIDVNILNIYSYKYDVIYLQNWIDKRVEEFKNHLKHKSNEGQLLITVSNNKNGLEIEGTPWESTITFDNSYFHMKEAILNKIDFFLNNRKWYEERGIPYNLGILLYGEPGCGKTRFIKQLMNYTKRHGIDIKLTDNFDFNDLKNIIYNEEIDYDYIIPQDQRVIIFEDIDAFGDVVKDRDIVNKKAEIDTSSETEEGVKVPNNMQLLEKMIMKETNKNNNNLSFLLNILDGLNECSGRIIIMTTNKIDHLDKALIRPGRIDIKIEFTKCSTYDVMMMIIMFWKIDIDINDMRTDIDMIYTSAEVINIFRTTSTFDDIKDNFII